MKDELLELAQEISRNIVNTTKDIDLILAYGGLARGTSNEFSDIDILILSDTIKITWNFIWNKRPISIYTISWSEAEQLAKGLLGNWCVGSSIFTQHIILWSKSEKYEEQFRNLNNYVKNGSQKVLEKQLKLINMLYGYIKRLEGTNNTDDTLTAAFLIWNIANGLVEILSALNEHPMKHNWGKQIDEIKEFRITPKDFIPKYTILVTSPPATVLPVAKTLVDDVNNLLMSWLNSKTESWEEFSMNIQKEYVGVLDCLNKVYSAVHDQNLVAARYAAVEFAEFAFWLFQGIRGKKSEVRFFKSIPLVINQLPMRHQVFLSALLGSYDLLSVSKASEEVASLLRSEIEDVGIVFPVVSSVSQAKPFLHITNPTSAS